MFIAFKVGLPQLNLTPFVSLDFVETSFLGGGSKIVCLLFLGEKTHVRLIFFANGLMKTVENCGITYHCPQKIFVLPRSVSKTRNSETIAVLIEVNTLCTPWKINREPTNHPFRKENDRNQTSRELCSSR